MEWTGDYKSTTTEDFIIGGIRTSYVNDNDATERLFDENNKVAFTHNELAKSIIEAYDNEGLKRQFHATEEKDTAGDDISGTTEISEIKVRPNGSVELSGYLFFNGSFKTVIDPVTGEERLDSDKSKAFTSFVRNTSNNVTDLGQREEIFSGTKEDENGSSTLYLRWLDGTIDLRRVQGPPLTGVPGIDAANLYKELRDREEELRPGANISPFYPHYYEIINAGVV
jgi:hypothetical protein